MSFTIYYPGCDTDIPEHICNDCGDDIEQGRVRSVAFIKKTYLPDILAAPTTAAPWTAGIVNGDVIVIPEVNGSYDGGEPIEGTGYGHNDSSLIGYKHTVNYKDPNYTQNAAFYNAIKNSRLYVLAYVSETQTHISDNKVQVIPKAPISDDLNSQVVWDVTVKFNQPDIPAGFDTPPTVFDACFALQ